MSSAVSGALPPTQFVRSNGIDLAYDSFGDPAAPALLLIMGLAAQMIAWHEDFCARLAGRGFRVVRFDNRDIGQSTRLTRAGTPHVRTMLIGSLFGRWPEAPYLLSDMAADAVGLLDALGIGRAHVVGASMGGAIVQEMAIRHPARLLSLTSIMSTTGAPRLPAPTTEAMTMLMERPPADVDGYAAHHARVMRVLRGPGHEEDAAEDAERGRRAFARGVSRDGVARQFAAIIASGDRTAALRTVRVPTLVIHGDADPLVRVECGIATADAIPGTHLLRIPGMGHALPKRHWPTIIDAIATHAAAAGAAAVGAAIVNT